MTGFHSFRQHAFGLSNTGTADKCCFLCFYHCFRHAFNKDCLEYLQGHYGSFQCHGNCASQLISLNVDLSGCLLLLVTGSAFRYPCCYRLHAGRRNRSPGSEGSSGHKRKQHSHGLHFFHDPVDYGRRDYGTYIRGLCCGRCIPELLRNRCSFKDIIHECFPILHGIVHIFRAFAVSSSKGSAVTDSGKRKRRRGQCP